MLEIVSGIIATSVFHIGMFPWIDFLGNYGLLAIMFLAGFELRPEYLKGNAKSIFAVSSSSLFVPFLALFITSYFILNYDIQTSLLVSVALSTTSLALVFPFLEEHGIMKTKLGSRLLGTAAVIDVLSMILIALMFSTPQIAMLLLIPFVLIGWKGLPKVGHLIFSRYGKNIAEIELKFLLFLLLGTALLAESVNVHASIIVFFAGMVFSETMQDYVELEKKLRGITFGFLAPIFFFRAGMFIDLGKLTIVTIWLTLLFFSVSMSFKYLGTYFAARKFMSRAHSRLMASSFSYKLSFSLIISMFGFESGLIGNELYTAILLTVVLSAVMPSLLTGGSRTEID